MSKPDLDDRELLELAAKAAGMDYLVWTPGTSPIVPAELRLNGQMHWNPIHDDGDALRLATKLYLMVDIREDGEHTSVLGDYGLNTAELHDDDAGAATRRAIVRAAAEIGRGIS